MTKTKGKKKDTGKQTSTSKTASSNLPTLRIGTRVRCTDDGVEGRITWANAVSVKIAWDDGEKVTWRRDELAGKQIEILDADTPPVSEPEAESPSVPTTAEQTTAQEESSAHKELPLPTPDVPPSESIADTPVPEALPEATLTISESAPTDAAAPEAPSALSEAINWNVLDASPESDTYMKVIGTVTAVTLGDAQAAAKTLYATPHIVQAPETAVAEPIVAEASAANQSATPTATQPKRTRKAKESESATGGEKKLSALDAAAKVLADEGRSMNCKELIDAMAAKGYWTSPGGKTPHATLASAILREITVKGNESRFVKTEPGKFARK
jgi:HB1, ASXL, restriction endonuclease HTH domain